MQENEALAHSKPSEASLDDRGNLRTHTKTHKVTDGQGDKWPDSNFQAISL